MMMKDGIFLQRSVNKDRKTKKSCGDVVRQHQRPVLLQ